VDRSRAFWNKGKKARVIVIVAGVVMNVVLALVAFGVLYLNLGIPTGTREKVTVVRLVEGSPAVSAGLMVKDRVLEVEGKPVGTGKEFSALMKSWAGLPVQLVIERGDTLPLFEGIAERNVERIFITVVPRVNPPAGEGPLGVAILDYPYLSVRSCSGQNAGCVLGVVPAAVKTVGIWAVRVVDGLREIGKSLLAAKTPEGVSGPIGIYKLTGLVAGEGFLPLVELVAVLSINLAVFNVLPIPALDGGRLFMVLLEWVRRKRVPADLEQKINSWGMVFLLGLVLLISLQDVMNLESVKKLLGR
jgi:regulator of sigma E protease